jgi:hypothetical protein
MRITFFFGFALLFCFTESAGQQNKQTVKGTITDQFHNTLEGATVKITNAVFDQGAVTNKSGYFEIPGVPSGRYRIQVSSSGYRLVTDELLVISGRESVINISIAERLTLLDEVQVTGDKSISQEIPGLKSMSIEKTLRVPANFFDPVRMATTVPGIIAANDQGNSIIIKGNSPNGLLWRLNGLDIVNPNHLSNAGTLSDKPVANGGGVNILSAQMLDRTNFYTGSFPANYGNLTSGAIDMNLRNGNQNRHEFTAQASLIGLDFSAEGPVNRNKNVNYLANYRYSTVGILSKLGVDFGGEVIDFQDFSFHLNSVNKNGSTLSFFGFGGLSKNEFKAKEQSEWEEDKDHNTIDYSAKTYALGLNYTTAVKQGKLSFALGYSGTDQHRTMITSLFVTTPHAIGQHFNHNRGMLSNNIKYEIKPGDRTTVEIGAVTDYISDELESYDKVNSITYAKLVTGSAAGLLIQPYAKVGIALHPSLHASAGIRYVNFTYNKTDAIEPRFLLDYQPDTKKSFNLSYSLTSQIQLPALYYTTGNKGLDLAKSHHITAAYHQALSTALKLTTEIYYQHLFNVPVEQNQTAFSAINLLEDYSPTNLVADGIGDNYGLSATLEKSFYDASYYLIGGSYYESTYKGSDGKTRDTRFSGKYTVNATYGKEWSSQKKNRTLGVHVRVLYLGGLRETPIDVAASQGSYETVYDNTRPFEIRLKDYFRSDLRIALRKNKPRYTRTLSIDIQNVTAQKNEAFHYYDFTRGEVVTNYQLGIIPVLVYRIDF